MNMNLPNRLTLIRIALVPFIVLVYCAIPADFGVIDAVSGLAIRDILTLILFAAASFTDYLDGQIARKNNLITSFGKFADPIADKMLVNTLLVLLVYMHKANVIAVLLMIARDLIVDGLRMVASQHGEVVSAGIYGKAKTVLQMIAIALLILCNWPFAALGIPVAGLFLWLATAMSLYSGYIYFMKLRRYVFESM